MAEVAEYNMITEKVKNNFGRIFKKLPKNKFVVAHNIGAEADITKIKLLVFKTEESLIWHVHIENSVVLEEGVPKEFNAFNLAKINGILPEPLLPFNLIEHFISIKLTGMARDKGKQPHELKLFFMHGGENELPKVELHYEKDGALVIDVITPESLISK